MYTCKISCLLVVSVIEILEFNRKKWKMAKLCKLQYYKYYTGFTRFCRIFLNIVCLQYVLQFGIGRNQIDWNMKGKLNFQFVQV